MNTIKNEGDYFVKDSEWVPLQKDEFRHIDIAKNIISIIENEEAPFNIAIVGRWGIGKSSLINMVKEHLDKKPTGFVVEEINAWKYEKEALRRVFLKKMLEKLGYKDKNRVKEFADNITSYVGSKCDDKMTFCDHVKEWLPLLGIALFVYIIGAGLAFVGQAIFASINGDEFSTKIGMNYLLTVFSKTFYIPMLLVLIQQYIKGSNGKVNFKLTTPIKSTDEYEEHLKSILENNKKKIITIIDDLDRLTPNKIVEALDAIKAFVNYDNCIFIVPFDDAILKKALQNKTISLSKNEHLLIESELFLDKLFQYKFYLPTIISSDLPQYAIDLIKSDAKDLNSLFDEAELESIVKEVLIHKSVSTPRQVKKIINAFSHHVLLAIRREVERVPKDTFIDFKGKRILAKISVLQADFSDFYSKMFDYPDLTTQFMTIVNTMDTEKIVLSISHPLKPYFIFDDSSYIPRKLTKPAEELYMFLSRTAHIVCENYIPFLYMDYDSVSVHFGSELSRDLRNSLTSGAIKIVKNRLDNNKETDLTELLYDILSNADPHEYSKCCEILVDIYADYNLSNSTKLMDLIAKRISSIYKSGSTFDADKIRFEQLCEFKKLASNTVGLREAVSDALFSKDENMAGRMSYFFGNNTTFDTDSQNKVTHYISNDLGNDADLGIIGFSQISSIDITKHFDPYLKSISLLEKLIDVITEEHFYDSDHASSVLLIQLLEKHSENNNLKVAIQPFLRHLADEDLFIMISEQLNNATGQIDEKLSTKLFNIFIKYKDQLAIKKSNKLLSKLKWIIEEAARDSADDYLSSILSDENIDNILMNVLTHKQISSIPKTIQSINSSFIDNAVGYDPLLQIQKQYTTEQRGELIQCLSDHITYIQSPNGEDFEIVGKTMDTLVMDNNNHEIINSLFIPTLYTNFIQRPAEPYSLIVLSLLPSTLPAINETRKAQFMTWSTSTSNINSYPESCIKLLDIFHEDIKDNHLPALATIMKLSNPTLIASILKLLRLTRNRVRNEMLTFYENFLVEWLPMNQLRNEIIREIDWFEGLDDIQKFIITGIEYDDIHEPFIKTSIRFLNNDEDSDNILSELLRKINDTHISVFYTIIKDIKNENTDSFISSLVKMSSEESDIIYLANIFRITIFNNPIFNKDVYKLTSFLFKQGDNSVVEPIVEILLNLPSPSLSAQEKRMWGDDLYNVFRHSSEKTKKRVYQLVLKIKVQYTFRKETSKQIRELSEIEQEIIKHI